MNRAALAAALLLAWSALSSAAECSATSGARRVALLELYKQGEATWRQDEPFGDIAITAQEPAREAAAQ